MTMLNLVAEAVETNLLGNVEFKGKNEGQYIIPNKAMLNL
jgi:hypothetical protein